MSSNPVCATEWSSRDGQSGDAKDLGSEASPVWAIYLRICSLVCSGFVRPPGLEPGTCGLRVRPGPFQGWPMVADSCCDLLRRSHGSPSLSEIRWEL